MASPIERRKSNAAIDAIDSRLQDQESFSYAVLSGDTGFGSSNTNVRRYTNAFTKGNDLTIQQSATAGDSITVQNDGMYELAVNFRFNPTVRIEVNRNSTVGIGSDVWPNNDSFMIADGIGTGQHDVIARTVELKAGDIIRMITFTASATSDNGTIQYLQVTRVR